MDQPRLLTREALIAHRKSFESVSHRALLWLAVSAIPMAIEFCVIAITAPEQGAIPVETPLWLRWLSGACLACLLGGVVGVVIRLIRAEMALRCPCCRTAIGNLRTLLQVIPTSRCPECEQIIVGSEGTSIDREFGANPGGNQSTSRTYERLESRQTLWTMARWAAAGIVWSVITKLLLDHWTVAIEVVVGEVVFPFVRVLVGAPGIVIFGWGILRAYRSIEARANKCPNCQESISGQIAALTGCCGNCGHAVRPDRVAPVDDSAIADSWTLAEFQRLTQNVATRVERHVTRQALFALPIIFGLLFTMKWSGECLALTLSYIVFAWFLRGMWQADQMSKQIQCPSCAQPLLRNRWWVIASRRCCGCGSRILVKEPLVTEE